MGCWALRQTPTEDARRKRAINLAILNVDEGSSGVVLTRESRVLLSVTCTEIIVMSLAWPSMTGALTGWPPRSLFWPIPNSRLASRLWMFCILFFRPARPSGADFCACLTMNPTRQVAVILTRIVGRKQLSAIQTIAGRHVNQARQRGITRSSTTFARVPCE